MNKFNKFKNYLCHIGRYIEDSLSSLATPVNFFIHNLAQFKFSSGENAPTILSFCPQAYSIATDGKVTNTVVVGFHKRFHPDTHYVSIPISKKHQKYLKLHA